MPHEKGNKKDPNTTTTKNNNSDQKSKMPYVKGTKKDPNTTTTKRTTVMMIVTTHPIIKKPRQLKRKLMKKNTNHPARNIKEVVLRMGGLIRINEM